MDADLLLVCSDCGNAFTFSQLEQEFFRKKGLTNQPKRCPNCRLTNRQWRRSQSGDTTATVTVVECHKCGAPTKVPFTPKGHRPIYCFLCLPRLAVNGSMEQENPEPISEPSHQI